MSLLHRRLSVLLALVAVLAFISGAGLDAPSVVPAAVVLLVALFVRLRADTARRLEPVWRGLALVLAARAAFVVFTRSDDPVLPMVDLLLLLLCAESLREHDRSADARRFALTFALLIAAAAYRPGPLFAPLFVAYVACAVVVLVTGHITRQAELRRVRVPDPAPRFILQLLLLSTVVLGTSGIVFLFFPRISQGYAARASPIVAGAVVGFGDRVSIGSHGASIQPNPEVVLRIEFPAGPPSAVEQLHWRGRSYDRFDGVSWSRASRTGTPPLEARWTGPTLEQLIYARRLPNARVLFGLHRIVDITAQSPIRTQRAAFGDYRYSGDVDPVYRVRSRTTAPPAVSLRTALPSYARELQPYLQLPPASDRLLALADSFRAASASPYDVARNVETWLRTSFDYTLDLPATRRAATLDHFLFVRRAGHCEYFSTAMAVLLRAAGIPARNVNGFLGGEWNEFGRFLTVTQNNAHSWVEVFFAGYGWVTFDPTPSSAAAVIGSSANRLGSLGRLFDGLGHRWGKWILDYGIASQVSLLDRVSGRFAAPAATPAPERRWWLLLAGVAVLAGITVAARAWRRSRQVSAPAVSRTFVELRHAYHRAGWLPTADIAPLQVMAGMSGAPGSTDARAAVVLYLRARFSAGGISDADAAALRRHAAAARAQLRRSGG